MVTQRLRNKASDWVKYKEWRAFLKYRRKAVPNTQKPIEKVVKIKPVLKPTEDLLHIIPQLHRTRK